MIFLIFCIGSIVYIPIITLIHYTANNFNCLYIS